MRIGIGLGVTARRYGGGGTPAPTPAPSWTVDPSISGTPTVGETLTGNPGTILNGALSAHAWYLGASAISGANGATYLIDAADEGGMITYRPTATGAGGSTQGLSAAVGPVAAAPDVTAPTITSMNPSGTFTEGDPVGGTLTANETVTWSKTGVDAALVTLDAGTGVWTLPSTVGNYSFSFIATDAALNASAPQVVLITIEEVGALPPIPTPTVAKDSAAGDPLAFSIVGAGYLVGYYVQVDMAGSSDFTAPYPTEATIRSEYRILTVEDFTDDDLDGTVEMDAFAALTNQKAGTAYLRIRYGQEADDGLSIEWGDWSNSITDTVVVLSPSTFDAVNKHANITLSNGNLTATNTLTNVGAAGKVRVTQSRVNKRFCQFTITAIPASNMSIGMSPGAHAWSTLTNPPGSAGSPAGISLNQGGAVTNGGITTSGVTAAFAANDIYTMAFDTATGKIWFGRTAAGGSTITWNGDPIAATGGFTPSGMTDWFAFALLQITNTNQRSITFNGGASAFVGTAALVAAGFKGYDL